MAETRENQSDKIGQAISRRDRDRRDVQRWTPSAGPFSDPLGFMSRMTEEMDRTFDRLWRDFGLQPRRSWMPERFFGRGAGQSAWAPRVEAFQKGDRFIVRAELPGLKRDDVNVELTDDALTIRGERREEREEEREGYFHTEREYGEFYRVVPLPDGVIGESANATFRDGVLEVTMQAAPSEASPGRRLEIKETSESDERKERK